MKAAVLYGNKDLRYTDWETPVTRAGMAHSRRARATGAEY